MENLVKASGRFLMQSSQLVLICSRISLNTKGTNCFICKHCDWKLNNIHSFNNQISSLRDEIKPYLEAFLSKSSTSLPISG